MADREAVVVLCINVKEDKERLAQFVKLAGLSLTVLLDSDGTVSATYSVKRVPTNIFVGRDGIIREVTIGALDEESVRAKLAASGERP